MKATILYHPESESARPTEEYQRDFQRHHGQDIELVSLDTREGAELAALFGVVRYPALLVRKDNGDYVKHWEGEHLPLMDEVAGYLSQQQ